MNPYNSFSILYYSKALSIPFLGSFLYLLQIQLLNLGLLRIFFASNKKNKIRKTLFKALSRKFQITYCRSTKFSRNLDIFEKGKLALDTPDIQRPKKMNKLKLYDLMWSLIFCDFVTEKTKRSIKEFLPDNYPTVRDL